MNHIDAAAEAASQHIGGWEPENATDLDLFLSSLPHYFEAVSGAFSIVAERGTADSSWRGIAVGQDVGVGWPAASALVCSEAADGR